MNQNIKTILSLILIIVLILIIFIYLDTTKLLFEHSFENYATVPINQGYRIYANGIIKEFDKYNDDDYLITARITDEEIQELKDLVYQVKDDLNDSSEIWDIQVQGCDMGTSKDIVYSTRLNKWMVLKATGDSDNEINKTEESQKILNLTQKLYNKYININN